MSSSKVLFKSTDLVCLGCGSVCTIQRKKGRGKAEGHIKHMYCPWCMIICEHYEVRDVSMFIWKYFDEDVNTMDNNTKKVLELLRKRKDESVRGEDKIFKKVLTKE